jgi:Flp pilus assembly protein TadG
MTQVLRASKAPRKPLRGLFGRFWQESDGVLSVELVFALPFLALWFVASYIFFDVFRVSYVNDKAAFTVADLVSRREENLNQAYVEGMNNIFDFLIENRGTTAMRISGVRYTPGANPGDAGTFTIPWSASTQGLVILTDADIPMLEDRLPIPRSTEMVILTETFVAYQPIFNVGISRQVFRTFVATPPRFIEQIGFDS